jgi:hypothetical protein
MRKAYFNSPIDEQRRTATRLLIANLSLPAFCYNYKIDRKVLIAVMSGAKPFSDSLWDEICTRTGYISSQDSDLKAMPRLRSDMGRLQILDEFLGDETIFQASTRLKIPSGMLYQYFTGTESLDPRQAMKLALILGLDENYFETAPMTRLHALQSITIQYAHRQPKKVVSEAISVFRIQKLRALVGHFDVSDFSEAFGLDGRRIYGVLVAGLRMGRPLCLQIQKALRLQKGFFDTPFSEHDIEEIQSVHNEMKQWPITKQLRASLSRARDFLP